MAQEPKDRRRRPSAQMVKAERYFFSNWPLQLLPSRRWRASVNKSGSHTRHVYAAADPHATRVRPAPPDGRQPVPYGQLCAWLFANKNSLPPSDFYCQQTVKRAETAHSTSASGVQSCAQVNIDLTSALSLWPVASLMGSRHAIPDLARLSLRKLAPRRGCCQHCAVRAERRC